MTSDLARERALIADAGGVLERLDAEATNFSARTPPEKARSRPARARLAEAEAALVAAEAELAEAQESRAGVEARRAAFKGRWRRTREARRTETELAKVAGERDALLARCSAGEDRALLQEALTQAIATAAAFEAESPISKRRMRRLGRSKAMRAES